jgi:hypothetical protein
MEEKLYDRSDDRLSVQSLKGRYAGRPLLIVGNGPSINDTPLEDFTGIPSIGMNKIDLLYERSVWRPSLVVSVNTSVIRQHHAQMLGAGIPVWLPRKARYFVPQAVRPAFNWFHLRPTADFSTDLARGAGFGATVTYTALQFAYYMEADPVIIVGVDHSFAVTGDTPNRYETLGNEDPNHFDPSYFANQRWAVPDLDQSEVNYLSARHAFDEAGRRVVDATVGGKLTIFDKIEIDEAVRLVK